MLLLTGIIFAEIILLYFITNRLTSVLFTLFIIIFRNKQIATGILTGLYLPGTVIHELAHLITAEVLRVPTGTLSFTPEVTRTTAREHEIIAGSVGIGATDPVRRFLIGFAPVIFGLFFLGLIVWVWNYFWPQLADWRQQTLFIILIGYLLFAVSNNMFSSHSDLDGSWPLIIFIILITLVFYFMGVRISLSGDVFLFTRILLTTLSKALGIVIGVNICLFIINILFLRGLNRIRSNFHR
ncbi:MAG: hypothetical protein AAB874_01790 [Patescibacteria group bacterium]